MTFRPTLTAHAAASLILCASLAGAVHAQTATASTATSASKKELVQKLMVLQQPELDVLSRSLVERPAAQLMQSAAAYMQQNMTAEQRDVAGKRIEADVKKYVEEATPLVRDRAMKLAPGSIASVYEDKFTEAELKELIAWFSSPTNKKFQQAGAEMRNAFIQKLMADAQPVIDPKLVALDGKIRGSLGLPLDPANGAGGQARAAKPAASGAKSMKK